jgi:hypothetical protein
MAVMASATPSCDDINAWTICLQMFASLSSPCITESPPRSNLSSHGRNPKIIYETTFHQWGIPASIHLDRYGYAPVLVCGLATPSLPGYTDCMHFVAAAVDQVGGFIGSNTCTITTCRLLRSWLALRTMPFSLAVMLPSSA